MSKLKPIHGRILVELDARKSQSEGGIHIPEVSRTAERWGTIRQVADDCEELQVDNRVYITPLQGTHYREAGLDYILLEESKVLCMETRPPEPDLFDASRAVVACGECD